MLDIKRFLPVGMNPFAAPQASTQERSMDPMLNEMLMQILRASQQGLQPRQMTGDIAMPKQGSKNQAEPKGTSWDDLKKYAEQVFPNDPTRQQVALAQVVLESGLPGKMSGLAQKNNLFGIKGNGVPMTTTEYVYGSPQKVTQGFQTNASPLSSFQKYAELLQAPRYSGVMSADNPYSAFSALQQAGYATDPAYSKKLDKIYEQYIAPLF